jgi:thiol:disulfide interchange protein
LLTIAIATVVAAAAVAQPPAAEAPPGPAAAGSGNLFQQLEPPAAAEGLDRLAPVDGIGDFGFGGAPDADKILVFGAFLAPQGDQPARLFVTAKLGPKWHVYSLTQPAGAVKATTIKLDPSDQYQLLGNFVPDRDPEVRQTEVYDVPLEEHYSAVTFSAPMQVTPGVDLGQLRIGGELEGMLCHDELGCMRLADVNTKFVAQLATGRDAQDLLAMVPAAVAKSADRIPTSAAGPGGYRADESHAVLSGYVSPLAIQPGTTTTLVLRADVDPGWKIYAYTEKSVPEDISSPTRIVLQRPEGWQLRPPRASGKAKSEQIEGFPEYYYHEGSVTWTAEILVPADASPGEQLLEGLVAYQTCSNQCDRPVVASFSTTVEVTTGVPSGKAPLTIAAADRKYPDVAQLADAAAQQPVTSEAPDVAVAESRPGTATAPAAAADSTAAAPKFDAARVNPQEAVEATNIWWAVGFAFAGGIILNVMPCVLPVIGLKILAFFQQAGESRSRALWLNAWYALGIVSVFVVLAVLGASLSEMFTVRAFGIVMAVVVFAMALSLMGVWELRVPSFLGGGAAQKLMEKEGPAGAFFKGIITTLLAIPCGAPLLSPALDWAGRQVHAGAPQNVYIVFTAIGVGMASPYLILGAFPELLRFLPKPGAWMETFKKAMGYLLLTAVVFILYFVDLEDMLPTIALLFSVWLACWLVGMLPITAKGSTKTLVWASAILLLVGTYFLAFHWLLGPAAREKVAKAADRQIRDGEHDEAVLLRFARVQGGELADLAALKPNGMDRAAGTSDAMPGVEVTAAGAGRRPGVVGPGAQQPQAVTGSGAGGTARNSEHELPWRAFDRALFEELVAAKKTILIDFTADWCLTCKTLEAIVLNTRPTRELVDRNGVVTFQADWTRRDPEVTEMLEILGAKQVPIIAIFPAGDPNQPIVFRGGYTQKMLLDALEKAGPSADVVEQGRTAMKQP